MTQLPGTEEGSRPEVAAVGQRIGLFLGPSLAVAVGLSLSDSIDESIGLGPSGPATAAIAVWMATWWFSEAVPIYVTALLPLALFPVFGVATIRGAAAPYAHELIFLFMGGFMIALAMQRSGLDRRFALLTLRVVGDRPSHMVAGFMGVAALLSMWVSNTATAVMMLPVATSVLNLADAHAPASWGKNGQHNFGVTLLLGIAYGASIGGVATPVGTPPNLFLLSFLSSEFDRSISFAQWMGVGVPVVVVMLPIAFWLLVYRLFPVPSERLEGGRDLFARQLVTFGRMSRAERIVLGVFLCVCTLWITRPLLSELTVAGIHPLAGLSDAGIAMLGAIVLFVAPDGKGTRVLDWETANRLPWGILILFGGGLSLAAAIGSNGVDDWIGNQSSVLDGLPMVSIVVAVIAGMVFLTELTSNTASTAALVPILAAVAPRLEVSPLALVVPAALAASFAFMLPVATPPNAVVFASGRVALRDMIRAGLWLNLIGIIVITALTFLVVLPVLGD